MDSVQRLWQELSYYNLEENDYPNWIEEFRGFVLGRFVEWDEATGLVTVFVEGTSLGRDWSRRILKIKDYGNQLIYDNLPPGTPIVGYPIDQTTDGYEGCLALMNDHPRVVIESTESITLEGTVLYITQVLDDGFMGEEQSVVSEGQVPLKYAEAYFHHSYPYLRVGAQNASSNGGVSQSFFPVVVPIQLRREDQPLTPGRYLAVIGFDRSSNNNNKYFLVYN